MIDNQFQWSYFLIFLFLVSTMIFLIGLLFFQYRFFCFQAQELILLKQQYYEYIEDIQKKLNGRVPIDIQEESSAICSEESNTQPSDIVMTVEEFSLAEASDDPDDDDEYIDESFIPINREPDYLQQSALEYVQQEQITTSDVLATSLDINQWAHYGEKKNVSTVNKHMVNIASTQPQKTMIKKPIKDFGLAWPIEKDKFWLSSLYGPRKRINGIWGFHHGIDMAAVKGTVVKAARGGKIVEASFQAGYGNTVVIEHTPHIKTRYAHLHTIRVFVGQVVKLGMIVGTVGETGFIRKKGKDGSHLHFEVYENGKRVNPLQCLPRAS